MKVLLDTHVLLWALTNDRRLKKGVREVITDPVNDIFVSAASFWELAIKISIGRINEIDLSVFEQAVVDTGFSLMPVTAQHAVALAKLPLHHRDPFDRMLIAQATTERANLFTHDAALAKYGSVVKLV